MRSKTLLLILICLILLGCHNSPEPYGVFDYEDFGPQTMAWEKIGMQWWQWDSHGISSDPNYKYDIKVVVYRDMTLTQIKSLYPVDRAKRKDFRYFEYDDSIKYLNERITELDSEKEEWAIKLQERLIQTKMRIQKEIISKN
jgi:hypothetical protein